jgi:signal peptidase I
MSGNRTGDGLIAVPAAKAGPAAGEPPGEAARTGRRWTGGFSHDLRLFAGLALLFTILTKVFVTQAFVIPSGSMEQTIRPGDRVLVNKLVYRIRGVQRGDIVVFSGTGSWGPSPAAAANPLLRWSHDALAVAGLASDGTNYIKRVIGLPGDRVACCDPRGRITVNGVPLQESAYLYPGERPSDERFSVTVPPGRLWVMGDHRLDSADSRGHADDPGDGTIPESAVVGRAFLIVWPPSQLRSLPIPATFSQPGLAAGVLAGVPAVGAPAGMLAAGIPAGPLAAGVHAARRPRGVSG